MASWLRVHPHWQHWFWSEAESTRLIGRRFPHYLHVYDQYPYKINRADVRRYFILYEYGGVYADVDVESVGRLDDVLTRYRLTHLD
jgi:mannosyltransferase OCH1-like enzyme